MSIYWASVPHFDGSQMPYTDIGPLGDYLARDFCFDAFLLKDVSQLVCYFVSRKAAANARCRSPPLLTFWTTAKISEMEDKPYGQL